MSEYLRLSTCWRFELTAASLHWNSWHQNGDPRWPKMAFGWSVGIKKGWSQHHSFPGCSGLQVRWRNAFPYFLLRILVRIWEIKKIRPSWIAKPDFLRPKGLIVNFAYLKSSFRTIAATDQLQSLKLRGRSSCWSFWSQAQRWSWWSVGQENVQCTWAKKGQNIPKHLISNMDQYIVSIKMDAPNI